MYRADRANIFARGKAEGDKEKAALEERVNAKEQRIAELLSEREQERATLEKLRDEASRSRTAAAEAEARLARSEERRVGKECRARSSPRVETEELELVARDA